MGNVIQWADYVKALEAIAEEQAMVSGMSVAEAAAARGFTQTASGMYLKTVMTTVAESAVGATATEVAAGATGGAATTAVNLTLVEGTGAAAGTAQVAGIGSVALPVAACIGAAAGGYLIGKELDKNETYHDFWDNLVFKTCDFVTGNNYADELLAEPEQGAITVPLIYDGYGNAYLPSQMTAELKQYLDLLAEGSAAVPTESVAEVLALNGIPYTNVTSAINVESYTNAMIFKQNTPPDTYLYLLLTNGDFYDKSNYISTTAPLKSVRISLTTKAVGFTEDILANHQNFNFIAEYAAAPVYCVKQFVISGVTFIANLTMLYVEPPEKLPEGVTQYTPSAPAITPITDPNGNTWAPVYLPSTSPTEMPDGEPVPEAGSDPSRLTPYIPPYQPQPADVPLVIPDTTPANPIVIPNPEPDTSIAPYPASNPAIDPSQLAEPVTPPGAENLPKPVNDGAPSLPLLPSVPSPSSAKGLLHVYNPTPAQVDLFGEWLWTTFSGDIIDTISKLFNNPMDAVIGLHELYCTPIVSAEDVNIRAGYLDSNVPSRLVTSRYKEIKCGAVSVPEYWGNYLDYSPYTKSYCYLPFIGIVELNTDDIVGSGVEITYRIDTYNGSCIALITTAKANSAESVTYQFEGNCAVSVPITSGMMTAVQNALIGIATTALSAGATAAVTVATGGTALPAAAMLGTVAAGASKQGLTSKNQVQYSGSFGSSFGAMGIKIPFLIIKRPKQKVVYGYNTNYGYPAHKMVLLSTCTGYLKAIEVNVVSSTATEAEKKMIQECLKTGVFVD
jgi:hypothetical protein